MLAKDSRILKENEFHPVQLRVFFVMITLYTFYFTCNNNLGVAADRIQQSFDLSNATFGILFTIFTLGFGLGQFFSGYLGDRYSPKLLMFLGAIGATAANIGFGLSSGMKPFAIFWAINAVSLSMGWSPGCSVLFRWIPQKRWGLFMGLFDAFAFLGGIIIYPVAGFAITFLSWRAAFFLPALLLLMWSVVFCIYVKDTPQQYGFTVEWEHSGVSDAKDPASASGDAKDSAKTSASDTVCLRDYADVMKHPAILLTALATICSQFVRWGLVNWIVKILITPCSVDAPGLAESAGGGLFAGSQSGGFGMALMAATIAASAMHWGGAFFSIALGHISDTVFHGSRWQTILMGFLVSTAGLLIIYFWGLRILMLPGGVVILGALLFFAGGCIQGVQAPLFNLPGDILGTRLGGTGVGIVNGWSYLGASFAGISLGAMMDAFGLTSCLLLMAGISLAGAVVTAVLRR
ncbi:MFS transporter [Clostridiales Family XIII bacterium BX16]|uniref:MFS transporter n=1 Tax=Lentihominibacter faecis TaxID=2764712 RepID=A0A923NAX1_9FIRM|nr:MFS transporter [Lentihominibacter faecis]MBC5998683.1 MFS transporter [Lentihominibacter faecis]